MLQEHGSQLSDEALRTLITEADNVINSRPLTVENLSVHDSPEALTPNHLLTSKTDVVLPPLGCFERLDLYSRKRWRVLGELVLDMVALRIFLTVAAETKKEYTPTGQ